MAFPKPEANTSRIRVPDSSLISILEGHPLIQMPSENRCYFGIFFLFIDRFLAFSTSFQ